MAEVVDSCIQLISSLFGSKVSLPLADASSRTAVQKFVEEPSSLVLRCATIDGSAVQCSCDMGKDAAWPRAAAEAYLTKQRPVRLDLTNLTTEVVIASAPKSALEALYSAIHTAFLPAILAGDGRSKVVADERVKEVLKDLDRLLGDTVRKTASSSTSSETVAGVFTVGDEMRYWDALSRAPGRDRERAGIFASHLRVISSRFDRILEFSLSNFLDFITEISDVLDSLWKEKLPASDAFPVGRMKNLLHIIGEAARGFVVNALGELDVWGMPSAEVMMSLRDATRCCEGWIETVAMLTGTEWSAAHNDHVWTEPVMQDEMMVALLRRIAAVSSLRSLCDEVMGLLARQQLDNLKWAEAMKWLQQCSQFSMLSTSSTEWEHAVAQFDKALEPIEVACATSLATRLRAASDSSQTLSSEVMRFSTVLSRSGVLRHLTAEREKILAQLSIEVESLDAEVRRRETVVKTKSAAAATTGVLRGRAGGTVVAEISWAQAVRARVASTMASCVTLVRDLASYRDFEDLCRDADDRLSRYQHGVLRDWCDATEQAIRSGQLTVDATVKVMDFDAEGNVLVRYNAEMVSLLRDVRQLTELGLAVPEKIRAAAADAEKHYRFGVQLQKVASFYNSLGAEIIAVQKPLLLEPLLQFEKVVQEGAKRGSSSAVTWADPKLCADFVDALQRAAERLSTQNRRLRTHHARICDDVCNLFRIDVVRQREAWKAQWSAIREYFFSVTRGSTADHLRSWAQHWDFQLYKAVEASYRHGLESLNEDISEIKVELTYTAGSKSLMFRPGLEEIRSLYYKEMKKFVSFPAMLQGLSDATNFGSMISRNAASLLQVYRKAEILFARLSMVRDKLRPWISLGLVDVEPYIESLLTRLEDLEFNFQSFKNKRRELDKLPDVQKIDCITVHFAPFKAAVDLLLQRASDNIVIMVRRQLTIKLARVEEYLETGNAEMSSRPTSFADIAKAQKAWKELSDTRTTMKTSMAECEDYRRVLTNVGGGAVDMSDVGVRLNRISGLWESFEAALDAFTGVVEDQRAALRGNVAVEAQGLNAQVEKAVARWHGLKPSGVASLRLSDLEPVYALLDEWHSVVDGFKKSATSIADNSAAFGLPGPAFPTLMQLEEEVNAAQTTWGFLREYITQREAIASQDWLGFRARLFELQDFSVAWLEKAKPSMKDPIMGRIFDEAEGIRKAMNGLKFARGEPFKEEHWSAMFKKLGMAKGVRLDTLMVSHFLEVLPAIPDNFAWLKDLSSRAQGEVLIRDALQELKAWCDTTEFKLMEHTSNATARSTALIKDWRDLFTQIGDNQSLLSSLKDSPYFKPFADTAAMYEGHFSYVDECAQKLNAIQRRWVYLEPVLSRGALPSEQARFKRIDDDFRDVMGKIMADPRVASLTDSTTYPNLRDNLTMMLDQLERCQRALSDFLEERRSKFPRFYFIGDDDLLEILGQAQNASVIQSHLKKLYQGVHRVMFGSDTKSIVAMCSTNGEVVQLGHPVPITDDVTVWLTQFTDQMISTLSRLLVDCLESKLSWLEKLEQYPSQIHCLAEQIEFTQQCEQALTAGGGAALLAVKGQLESRLGEYTSADVSRNPLLSLKIKAIIMDAIHHMDVLDQLVGKDAKDVSSWLWQKQLRFYMNKEKKCIARMVDASLDYTYEYQGNTPKLVHTPLTDKCYMVLTQGLCMGLGGNPYGPAGTGKTETVKALGAAIGRQVLVFNCDEGIDFQSMGRIFIGIVKCGAWGCFDEFNRLKEDQLSAISQQIQVIQAAIKDHIPVINLLGLEVKVNFQSGIFVTLNPAGKGYGGRSKLPDNLKQLFRPVAMTKPDNEQIAEVILFCEGFMSAKELGRKVVSVFNLASQLLSSQQHYDWGLRSMKTVLNTGGTFIQSLKRSGQAIQAGTEADLVIKAIRVNTLSKLTFADSKRFIGLLNDVFPGVPSQDVSNHDLEVAIKEVMADKAFCLEFSDTQFRKMLQLKEALDQRIGCLVVGPSGCGKSTLWQVLQAALINCGHKIVTHVMNPKSMPRSRLLGEMDHDTREWTDGVLTAAARQVVKEPQEVKSWIVCDGDVDPEWIESLNSVLDDNHLLTLPNGERIAFGSNVNFLFETHDLQYASPATVSRMGLIYLSDDDVDVGRVVRKWINTLAEEEAVAIKEHLDTYFYKALDWARNPPKPPVVETTLIGQVVSALTHVKGARTKQEVILGLIRGFGSNFDMEARAALAKSLLSSAGERLPDPSTPLDFTFENGAYKSFSAMEKERRSDEVSKAEVLKGYFVPVAGALRTISLVSPWMERMEPFVLVGPEGCGKSMLIRNLIRRRKGTTVTTLNCSAQTSAEHVIQKIRQFCVLQSSVAGRVYRPREGDRLVLYLKDINLPKPDKYGTCSLIAFLQQLLTFHGFYDEHREFLGVDKLHIVASMTPSSTVGRHALSTRFTAIVRLAFTDYPDHRELVSIYSTYLLSLFGPSSGTKLRDDKMQSSAYLAKVGQMMVDIHASVSSKFTVDEQRHYLFTPRDLTSWALGLLRYNLEEEPMLDVVIHEALRLYRDRLVDSEAFSRFDAILSLALRSSFSHTTDMRDMVFTTLTSPARSAVTTAADMNVPLKRVSIAELTAAANRGLVVYEREERSLNMQFFHDALVRLTAIDRIISGPGGCALLVGRSGVGRRAAASLASHMRGYRFVSPSVGRNYGLKSFLAELKIAFTACGVEGEHVTFYLEDHHLQDEAVLESVNSLLASGEVSGMYAHEEMDALLGPLKEQYSEFGSDFKTLYDFFVHRVRVRLHVCIGMDPTSDEFLRRCERNPSLYTRCAIVWLGAWSKPVIMDIAAMQLQEVAEQISIHVSAESVVECIATIHDSMRLRGAAPRDVIALLGSFKSIYQTKVGGSFKEVDRLKSGLAKLEEAQGTVDELGKSAGVQREQLKVKQSAADKAMNDITEALAMASDRKKEVEILQHTLADAEKDTRKRKAAIEEQLVDVMPLVEKAKSAVGSIRKDHLDEIRSLKMPPEAIADVLSAVLLLLGINDTSWNSMKKFLGNRGVKEDILGFDAHRINPKIRAAVGKLMREKSESFEKETITRASVAAAPLAEWVVANLQYSETLEKIAPLENEMHEATAQLETSQQALDQNKLELEELDRRVQQLKEEFGSRTAEAETLRQALAKTEDTLKRAQSLLSELSGERDRWRDTVGELHRSQAALPLVCLMSAAMVTYAGRCSEDLRHQLQKEWKECIEGIISRGSKGKGAHAAAAFTAIKFDLVRTLASESESLLWKSEGLPSDTLSVENVVIILSAANSSRTPFIIDPSTRATEWLQQHLLKDKASPLEVIGAGDSRFQNQVELAIRFGKTLFIKDCDRVEPMLYPILRRDFIHQGPRSVVQLADKLIDVNEKFRLFMCTRNANPSLPPDAASIIAEVNFTVTRSGLESQLLGCALQHEQPELEAKKSQLLQKEEQLKLQLIEVEDSLLAALAKSSGNILENTALLASLADAKRKSNEISTSLQGSEAAAEELERQRQVYQPFAAAGARLFFCLQTLQGINNMYQFSLGFFLRLFSASMEAIAPGDTIENRIRSLIHDLEVRTLLMVGQSLLKEDRLTFALHLVHTTHPELFGSRTSSSASGWSFFLGEAIADTDTSVTIPPNFPLWASRDRVVTFKTFTATFPQLVDTLNFADTERWSKWAHSATPEREFPPSLASTVSAFDQLLAIQVLRPDRFHSAIQNFVCEALNVPSINPTSASVHTLFEASSPSTPILMITMPGADPSRELSEYAGQVVGAANYMEFAMGGGVQQDAAAALQKAAANGQWICLKNLHLVSTWLPQLEKEVSALKPAQNFRLWLTTECHPLFSPVLLQSSLKATFEAPPGIKKSLQRTYEAWGPDFVEGGTPLRAQLLFLMAWLNAVAQERRTFVPQGWTKSYEFSFADLRAGASVVETQLRRVGNDKVPWAFLHGLIENTVYGGRIDNASDLRILRAYLATVFHPDVISGRSGKQLARGVTIPTSSKFAACMEIIDALPDADAPYLFSLPDNIERSIQRVRSSQVIHSLKSMGSASVAAAGFEKDVWREKLLPMADSWERFAASISTSTELVNKLTLDDDPVAAFLMVELKFAEKASSRVSKSFAELRAVLDGSGLLSSHVLNVGTALAQNTLPLAWTLDWDGPEEPTAWLRQLMQKYANLQRWGSEWIGGILLKRALGLTDLFKPSTFLNALRQRTARLSDIGATRLGVDKFKLVTTWDRSVLPVGFGFTLSGLYVQGAGFDGHRFTLIDVQADAPELQPLPDVHVCWVPVDFPDPLPAAQVLSVPVYQSLDRTNMVLELSVPVASDKAKWVLAGVAAFLDA